MRPDHHDVVEDRGSFGASADWDGVASCRDAVGEFVINHGASRERAEEIRLVVSELASNVVRHTTRPSIQVKVTAHPEAFAVDVDGGPVGALVEADPSGPPTSQWHGRGLLIVQSIADDVDVIDAGGERLVRCIFRR